MLIAKSGPMCRRHGLFNPHGAFRSIATSYEVAFIFTFKTIAAREFRNHDRNGYVEVTMLRNYHGLSNIALAAHIA